METINYQGQEVQTTRSINPSGDLFGAAAPRPRSRFHQTITYGGEHIPVMVVSEINVRCGEGQEYILTDAAGRYFFRRQLHEDRYGESTSRDLVHRISLAAAILWQTSIAATSILRTDTADFLNSHLRRHLGEPSANGVTVTLDEHSSDVARRCLAYNEHAPVHHLGDLVNAAVAFFADDSDQGTSTREFVEQARARRLARRGKAPAAGTTPVTIHLSAVQLRMFQQIADYADGDTLAEAVTHELGQHVALHLECYHNHDLEAARTRWAQEGKDVA